MTLQLLHSEFPYIWGKFDFLFYQCGSALRQYSKWKVWLQQIRKRGQRRRGPWECPEAVFKEERGVWNTYVGADNNLTLSQKSTLFLWQKEEWEYKEWEVTLLFCLRNFMKLGQPHAKLTLLHFIADFNSHKRTMNLSSGWRKHAYENKYFKGLLSGGKLQMFRRQNSQNRGGGGEGGKLRGKSESLIQLLNVKWSEIYVYVQSQMD